MSVCSCLDTVCITFCFRTDRVFFLFFFINYIASWLVLSMMFSLLDTGRVIALVWWSGYSRKYGPLIFWPILVYLILVVKQKSLQFILSYTYEIPFQMEFISLRLWEKWPVVCHFMAKHQARELTANACFYLPSVTWPGNTPMTSYTQADALP